MKTCAQHRAPATGQRGFRNSAGRRLLGSTSREWRGFRDQGRRRHAVWTKAKRVNVARRARLRGAPRSRSTGGGRLHLPSCFTHSTQRSARDLNCAHIPQTSDHGTAPPAGRASRGAPRSRSTGGGRPHLTSSSLRRPTCRPSPWCLFLARESSAPTRSPGWSIDRRRLPLLVRHADVSAPSDAGWVGGTGWWSCRVQTNAY